MICIYVFLQQYFLKLQADNDNQHWFFHTVAAEDHKNGIGSDEKSSSENSTDLESANKPVKVQ